MDSSSTSRRLQQELESYSNDPCELISAGLVGNDLFHWQATLLGEQSSPYANGLFFIDIQFGSSFPSNPPSIQCKTKVFHPNILLKDGTIHINDMLSGEWLPSTTMKEVFQSLSVLFYTPKVAKNDSTPQSNICNPEMALLFTKNRSTFNEYAMDWTKQYAT